jgi:hypothetical protein
MKSVIAAADTRSDLEARIAAALAPARTPAREAKVRPEEVDLETWDHVGDPLAEALIFELRTKRSQRDLLAAARDLQAAGNPAAVDFFKDVEHVPSWFDFEATRAGAAMSSRNVLGMLFGLHGALPITSIDGNIPGVLFATGRMTKEGDFRRRTWETATGFIGATDVDGMKPGGKRWEAWVRIRLMHTMVRLGVLARGNWKATAVRPSMPIAVTGTAAGIFLFGVYRSQIMKAFGYATDAEIDSATRMWQWIAKILGAPPEMLYEDLNEQRRFDKLQMEYLYSPTELSREFTALTYKGLGEMREFLLPQQVHAAIGRYVLSPRWTNFPGSRKEVNVADDLGIPKQLLLDAAVAGTAVVIRTISQLNRIKPVRQATAVVGAVVLKKALKHGLDGIKAEYSTHM